MRTLLLTIAVLWSSAITGQDPYDLSRTELVDIAGPELVNDYKNELLVDRRGLLWVASMKGLYVFDGDEWHNTNTLYQDTIGVLGQYLESVIEDSTGTIWFSTQSNGICSLDPESGDLQRYLPSGFTGQAIHDKASQELLLIDDVLIIQTYRGFVRFDPYERSFIDFHVPYPDRYVSNVSGEPGSHPSNWIHQYLPDPRDQHNVLLATRMGVITYDLQTGETTELLWPYVNNETQTPRSALDLAWLENQLLVATYGAGIARFDQTANGQFELAKTTGVPGPGEPAVIQSFFKMNNNTLLFASDQGPGVYRSGASPRQLVMTDAPKNQGHYRNIVIDRHGLLWTNNSAGVYRSAEAITSGAANATILLNGCSSPEGTLYRGFASNKQSFTLNADHNSVAFSFVRPIAGNARYSYYLKGFDKDWVESGDQNTARYTNLPAGEYVFRVRALSGDGTEAERELATLSVQMPFYKSRWFLLACVLTSLLIVAWIVRSYIHRERMKSQYDLRIAELEMQSLRSQMNPHFIFNSLNSIKNYVVNKGPDEAAEYLSKFSQLIRMILENSKQDLLSLDREIDALRAYVEIEQMRFNHSFEFELTIGLDVDTQSLKIPPMLVQPYVENAIWHGLQHKSGKGRLIINFKRAQEGFSCTVTDNGIGRAASAEMQGRRRQHKKSLGVGITTDRITAINSLYGTNSRITTEDLYEGGEPAGTSVKIFVDQAFKP